MTKALALSAVHAVLFGATLGIWIMVPSAIGAAMALVNLGFFGYRMARALQIALASDNVVAVYRETATPSKAPA